MQTPKRFTKRHKGSHFSAFSLDSLEAMIKSYDLERSIFHRSKVYTYESYARDLEDGSVELVERFNNGEIIKKSLFADRDDFYTNSDKFKL